MPDMTASKILLFIVHAYILFDGSHGERCAYLTIKKKTTNEDVTFLCESAFQTPDCINFVKSFNRSDLPAGFPEEGLSVDGPARLEILTLVSKHQEWMYPGMSVTWESPLTDIGKNFCNGYLVIWTYHNGSDVQNLCRLFKINSPNEKLEEFVYTTNIDFIRQSAKYSVSVFSMPSPAPDKKDEPRFSANMNIFSGSAYVNDMNPGWWSPSIICEAKSTGTIDVKFSLSPPSFNLTQFKVILLRNLSNDIYLSKMVTENVHTPEKPEGFVSFSGLSSGTYKVKIWVEDPFWGVEGQCLCWTSEGDNKHCNNICGSVMTDWFNLTVAEPTKTTRPTTPETTLKPTEHPGPTIEMETPKHSASQNKNEQPYIVVGIVGSVFVAVVLVAFVVLFIMCRRKDKVKKMLLSAWQKILASVNVSSTSPKPVLPEGIPFSDLNKKTLYIVSAEDHRAHSVAAGCLAKFLETHCCCEVIYPPQCDVHQTDGAYTWFIRNISRAHYVLYLDSKGAAILLDAHVNDFQYEQRRVGPEGDMFDYGIKHLLANKDVREKTVMASFGGRFCSGYLPASTTYELPTHIPQLLEKIHGLNRSMQEEFNHCLPLQVENISMLKEGIELLDAIAAVENFEKKNPKWMLNWGTKTPKCQRSISNDSGKGSLHGCSLSVSSQNLCSTDPPAEDYITTDSSGCNPQTEDVLSYFTLTNEVYGPNCSFISSNQRTGMPSDEQSGLREIVPPRKSPTMIDTFSNAINNINNNDGWESDSCCEPDQVHKCQSMEPSDREEFKQIIAPPVSPSQFQIDSVSTALREINKGQLDQYRESSDMHDYDIVSF